MSSILVGVSGSAACFKAVSVCSELKKQGHEVRALLTRSATRLVTPLQFSCVSGTEALHDEWRPVSEDGMDHIEFARNADLFLVAPASADRLGQLALGLAGDLLGSTALAFGFQKPRLIAPAMNPEMWAHPAIRRHVETLQSDGWNLVGPCSGVTACGEDGLGRMVEPQDIVAAVQSALEA